MSDLENVTMGIQITLKKDKSKNLITELGAAAFGNKPPYDRDRFVEGSLNSRERYAELTKNVSRYIEVRGMFEVKEGFEYDTLDKSLNPDLNTWKKYDTNMVKNK